VDEMFRMLGREHEADLEREAAKRRSAAQVGPARAAEADGRKRRSQNAIHRVLARVAAFVAPSNPASSSTPVPPEEPRTAGERW
jgi:hypothetical protein